MADTQQKGKGGKPQNQKPQNTEKQQNNPKPDENKKPKNNQSNANPNPNKNETQASSQPASKKEEVKAPVAESTPQTNGAQQKPQTANQNQPKEKGAQPTQQKKDAPPKKQLVTGKGVVKSVPAGDTLIVIHMEKNAPPKEKKITLSNIHAPRLGHRSSSQKEEDEEFAWQSREFLRKAAVGKNVTYVIEGTSKSGKRDFGLVHIIGKDGSAQDLASLIVAEGWASVPRKEGESKGPLRADVEELLKLEEAAKKDKKGIFSNDKKHAKRPIIEISNVPEFYEKNKGHPVQGVVENVLNGSTVIVSLLPQLVEVRLLLSGVECPVQKNTGEWEPYGREAKFVTEHFLLHRDVQVIFEGADKYNLYGTLNLHGNNISEELLRRGLARLVEWSAQRTNFKDKLKAAEKFAQEKKACLYANFEQKPVSKSEEKKQLKPGKELFGKVIEIVSPGSVIVSDAHGNEHKISLSSIRAPRGGSLMPKPSSEEKKTDGSAPVEKSEKEKAKEAKDRSIALERTYAFEGKEFLRKKLIGQKVRCVLDYFRAPQNPTGQKEAEKPYWSVYYEKNNIAVELVAHGFASATAHRGGEQRSKDYEDILKAEALAKRAGKGVHTSEEKASVLYINDVTSDPQKARNFLSSLKRGKNRGVVEYIAHASRFKIYVPKENCELFLNLSAVKTPKTPGSEFFQESQYFVKNLIHQRDVEFEVVSVDKGGSFVGHVWINKENLAVLVLQEGFGTLLRAVARDTEYFNDLRSAEDVAKKTKKNLWHNYDEAAEQAAYEKRRQEAEPAKQAPKQELVDVIVTEIIDASKFYVQIVGKDAEKLDELMQTIAAKDKGTEAYSPKFGELVLAQFTADDAWYRAKTVSETTNGEVKVFYIDYGNTETVQTSRVRRISDDLTALPPQAVEAHLAYVKPPTLSEDYGTESAEFLKELVEGKTMMANVEYREGNQLFLSLGDRESQVHVNAALVRAGLARVEKVRGRHLQPLIAKLREEEEKARSAHTYIWEYGDAGSDDEDDDRRPQKRGSAPPAKKSASAPAKKEGKEEK